MLPSGTLKSGFSGFFSVVSSLSTPAIRFALAILIVSITKISASIIRLIRICIQKVSILVSSPVVSSLPTIIFAPNQLNAIIEP